MGKFKCAFGKVKINGFFPAKQPFGTDLFARMAYFESGRDQSLIIAFDLPGTFPADTAIFRESLSALSGIPSENIWFHELQLHAVPTGDETSQYVPRLVEICWGGLKEIMATACEAQAAFVTVDMGMDYSVNREQYIPGLGGVTVWAGLEYDEEGNAFSADSKIMLLNGYEYELKEPVCFDEPVDSMAYLILFRNNENKLVGSVARFAAHPDTAVLFDSLGITGEGRYSFDWPGYLCGNIEEKLHCPAMYINGPCADLSVKKNLKGMDTFEKADKECRRIAGEISSKLLKELDSVSLDWEDIRAFSNKFASFTLPVREAFIRLYEEPEDERIMAAEKAFHEAVENNEPAYIIKKLADECYYARQVDCIVHTWCGFTEEEIQSGEIRVNAHALKLNGYIFLSLPGECLCATTNLLRSETIGNQLITVDQVDGYYGYIATSRSLRKGGYTYWGSWIDTSGEKILRDQVKKLID
mgnify:CR=1 FL=1